LDQETMTTNLSLFDRVAVPESTGLLRIKNLLHLYPLPSMVRVIALWEPYASLVVDGKKTIETREWPWPYDSIWLVIHASHRVDSGACARLGLPKKGYVGGHIIGMVWVAAPSRPLLPEDEQAACFYAPDRYAWPLKHAIRFVSAAPFPGPQKFSSVERDVVVQALGLSVAA
jgi:hypothetical protein